MYGNKWVQNNTNAARVGTSLKETHVISEKNCFYIFNLNVRLCYGYLNKREKYSFLISKDPVLFKRPMNEYAVKRPDSMINGSVYRLAALAITVHGLPKSCVQTVIYVRTEITRVISSETENKFLFSIGECTST